MQPQTERRAMDLPRLPVDLLVELTHDGDKKGRAFEADAIDLGPGGIGLRAAVLPALGQRLRCRFEVPGGGPDCEAQGEVVWTHDGGSWGGAFGLRFDGMDHGMARALDEIAPQPPADPETPPELRAPRMVKVRLDGVGSDIEGELVTDGQTFSIEQPMPFLQVGRGAQIEAGGVSSRAVLQKVRLRVERGTPRLVLELGPVASDEPEASDELGEAAFAATDAGVSDDDEASLAGVDAADTTMQDEPLEGLLARAGQAVDDEDAPPSVVTTSVAASTRTASTRAVVAARTASVETDDEDDVHAGLRSAEALRTAKARPEAARSEGTRVAKPAPHDEGEAPIDQERETPILAQRAQALRTALAPKLAEGMVAGRAFFVMLGRTLGPLSVRARDVLVALWKTTASRAAARSPRLAGMLGQPARRRTTSPPPAASVAAAPARRARGQQAVPSPAKPLFSRNLVMAIVACFTVGLVAYGMASRGEASDGVEVHRPAEAGSWGDTAESAVPGAVDPVTGQPTGAATVTTPEPFEPFVPGEAAGGAAPAGAYGAAPAGAYGAAPAGAYGAAPTGAYGAAPAGAYERAMPEAATQAGPMPAPTYPSLADLRAQGAAPAAASMVTAAPEATEPGRAVVGGMTFGAADVPSGRTTTLAMSAPVESLEGVSDANGFTVTVRGALSLDRAGPIAATNPSIERASILNRGDHSVLTLRFVAGRTPAYRVVAHGASLDVIVGR